jgi:flagellar hook-basal body complex protein FliE
MSDLPINNIGANSGIGETSQTKQTDNDKGKFESVINEAINKVSQVQEDVDKAVNELSSGGDITNAVLAIEKADMTFQMMVEVRNKLISTYQEVMRLQV